MTKRQKIQLIEYRGVPLLIVSLILVIGLIVSIILIFTTGLNSLQEIRDGNINYSILTNFSDNSPTSLTNMDVQLSDCSSLMTKYQRNVLLMVRHHVLLLVTTSASTDCRSQ